MEQSRAEFYRANFTSAFIASARERHRKNAAEARRKEKVRAEQSKREKERRERAEAERLRQARLEALADLVAIRKERDAVAEELIILREVKFKGGLKKIIDRICRATGVSWAEIASIRREQRVALARQAICYWAARTTSLSYPQIGRRLGRDHTTVLYAVRVYPKRRAAQGRTLRPARG